MSCKKWINKLIPDCSEDKLQEIFLNKIEPESNYCLTNLVIYDKTNLSNKKKAYDLCLELAEKFELAAIKYTSRKKDVFWVVAGWYNTNHSED